MLYLYFSAIHDYLLSDKTLFHIGSNLGLRELIQSAVSSLAVNNQGHKVDAMMSQIMFCVIVITFANSLNTDQDRHSVGPDLDPNCLTL